MQNQVIVIGYSGHAYVACDILISMGRQVIGYCDVEEKKMNPFGLPYFGSEQNKEVLKKISEYSLFVTVGDNSLRKKISDYLQVNTIFCVNAVHSSAVISSSAKFGTGVMIAPGVVVNALSEMGSGAICNTGSIIEHECRIGGFVHLAPGAVLCGNVTIGEGSFVGANSVVKQGVTIGKNVLIGAGSVIINDIPDNSKAWGNPSHIKK